MNTWAGQSTSFPKGVISSFLRTHFLFINRISRQLGRSHTWINRHQLQDPPILPYVWLYRTSAGYLYYREYYRTVIIKIPKLFDLLPKNNSVLAMGSKNMDDNGAMDSLRSVGYTIIVCNYRSCTIPLKDFAKLFKCYSPLNGSWFVCGIFVEYQLWLDFRTCFL